MLVPSQSVDGQMRRISAAQLVARGAGFAFVWAILAGGKGWAVGVPVICLATAVSFQSAKASSWSLAGIARFLPYFIWNSLRGGVDVAARALNPRLPIDPAVLRYTMKLDDTKARVLMANAVTLLPGTLSADLQGNVLEVHVLSASDSSQATLAVLERRVADVFPSTNKATSA